MSSNPSVEFLVVYGDDMETGDEMEERRYSSWLLERLAIGEAFRLRYGSSSIGRHHSSIIRILDSSYVSRNHAIISVSDDDQKVHIQDLDSVNGIYVNKELHRNDTIEINADDQVGIGVLVEEDASSEDPVFILKHVPLRLPNNRNIVGPGSLKISLQNKSVASKPTAAINPSVSTNSRNNNTYSESSAKSSTVNSHPNADIIIISDDDDDDDNVKKKQNVEKSVIISNVKIEKTCLDELPSCSNKVISNSTIAAVEADATMNRTRDQQNKLSTCSNVTALTSNTINENIPLIPNLPIKSSIAAAPLLIKNSVDSIKNQEKELPMSSNITFPTIVTVSDNIFTSSTSVTEKATDSVTNQKTVQPASFKCADPLANAVTAHMPIISRIKQERVRTVSADIKSIFGVTDKDEAMMGTIKTINPYIYNEIGGVKSLVSGDCIYVSSDDEDCEKIGDLIPTNTEKDNASLVKRIEQPVQANSPNIFETSFNTSNEEGQSNLKTNNDVSSSKIVSSYKSNIPEKEDYAYEPRSDDEDVEDLMFSQVMISDTKAEKSKANYNLNKSTFSNNPNLPSEAEKSRANYNLNKPTSSDNPNSPSEDGYNNGPQNEDDEIMFSQVAINDMKAELADENIDDLVESLDKVVDQMEFSNSELVSHDLEKYIDNKNLIKKELDASCWIISDDEDEDFHKELESKVSGWSAKLFSQSLTQGNMSQIYDIENYSDDEDGQDDHESNSVGKNLTSKDDDGNDDGDDLHFYTMKDNELIDMYISKKDKNAKNIEKDYVTRSGFGNPTVENNQTEKNIAKNSKIKSCNNSDNTALTKCNRDFMDEPLISVKEKLNSIDPTDEKINEVLYSNKANSPILKSKSKKIVTSSDNDDSQDEDRETYMDITTTTGSSNIIDSPVIKKNRTKTKRVVSSSEEEDVNIDKLTVSSKNEKESKKEPQRRLEERRKSISSHRKDNTTIESKHNICKEVHRRKSFVRENSKDENIKSNQSKTLSPIDASEATNESKSTTEPTKSSKEKPAFFVLPNEKRGPAIIDAPQLPKHKGKLRGVSAVLLNTKAKLSKIQEGIRCENYTKDLKRKWLEKPSIAKKREKEKAKVIKESRKERLKEIADKQQKDNQRTAVKRKTSQDETSLPEHQNKKPKVKVTTVNRGAFLTKESKPVPPKPYRIPKVATTTAAISKNPSIESSISTSATTENIRRVSSDSFAQQLSKPDILLLMRQNSSDASSTDSDQRLKHTKSVTEAGVAAVKESAAVRSKRATNKITFESMQRNFVESHQNQKKLKTISNVRTCLSNIDKPLEVSVRPIEHPINSPEAQEKPPTEVPVNPMEAPVKPSDAPVERKKKKVRFNDTPIIHYIDRISSATKKVDRKDLMPMSTINDRRHIIRQKYPIVDCTNKIISMILTWSNEWHVKRNADAQAAEEVVMPMPNQFNTFNNYKSILIPLMKLEFLSVLEREYNARKFKKFKVTLEYVTNSEDRMMLITKYNARTEALKCDLVILDFNDKHIGTFAYASANRKGTGTCSTLVFEIIGKNVTKEYLNCIKEIDVHPVVDNIRVEFGAFNAVFQLESTPLFDKILNPLDLLKSKSLTNVKFKYKGFDKINGKQESILLNAYGKFLDETTPNITLIKGPPGTGKSCVITNLALQTLYGDEVRYMDKKILICAQSNGAVDVIASKLFDVQQRMRPNIMFRVIRYGIMDKVHKSVMPIMLQKIVERDQMRKLAARNSSIQEDNKENLRSEILKLEAKILEMQSRNIENTVEEEELIENQKQLNMMRNIINQFMRPEDERSIYTWYLTNANIVCTTLSSCVKLSQYVNYFDVCIIDEATQCTEPWTLLPLRFGINSLVLVGDTQQLPATVLSKKAMQLGLGNSMFTRIQRCLENVHLNTGSPLSNIICSLQTQYRMHPEICRWPNLYFYKNELINAPITQQFKSPLAPFSILNLAYSQNQHCNDGKISNNLEAEFVVNLLKALDGYIPSKYNSYGVITPYAEHRTKLEVVIKASGISNIMVNTIDSYQGVEKDVIIISNARTHGIGFLANYQRLNVALTRPRKCLILCGNFKNLESVPSWRSLLNNARERKVFHEISATNALDVLRNVIPKIKV